MNHFLAFKLQQALQSLQMMEGSTFSRGLYEGKASTVPADGIEAIKRDLETVRAICKKSGFDRGVGAAMLAITHLSEAPPVSVDLVTSELRTVREAIVFELYSHSFLLVSPGMVKMLDQPALFGKSVKRKFPGATADIRDAGNCLAAECGTAAVFHLMRTVEWGLRALCVHFGLRKAKSVKKSGVKKYTPISHVDWETMLNQLQLRVDAKADKMKRGLEKQRFQQYYYPILQDIRAMRDAWRNHVMHSRAEYTPTDAKAIYQHVKRLMTALSSKVSEV